MRAFDWPAMMRAGMLGLGLKPAEFWALTPAELHVMAGQRLRSPVMGRDGLERLLAAFPDETGPEDTGEMSDVGP